MGKFAYSDFKSPKKCKGCHKQIYNEWKHSLMAQSFTHEWDQVEYFKLALPHAKKFKKVSGVKAGCIACHGPLAFLTGDIPPKTAEANTRANEGVSCEVCHHIEGTTEKVPFNFSFTIKPGKIMNGPRKNAKASYHKIKFFQFLKSPEFCATCHDEASPYGAWVKSTYREWKESSYAKNGIRCQDCHMYYYKGKSASRGKLRNNIAHHVFHGSHSKEKLLGAVDLAMYVNKKNLSKGAKLKIKVELFNGKVGHYIPSGSTEERMLWLEIWAIDKNGNKYPIPVKKKGFKGEEYTIANSNSMAYQAIGEIMEITNFKGLKRDGDLPDGARIFRKPFFDEKGRMTICQWYTKENNIIDYRIAPRETKIENYDFIIPDNIPTGKLRIVSKLFYSEIPSSIGKFFKLPETEYAPILVNQSEVTIMVK
jgi:nitrate/TMAO reductase-like tetraheme cytochrome c subunit